MVITRSAKLSGSYNAAVMGRDLVLEEEPEKKIFILDSESAAAGETRLALLDVYKRQEDTAHPDIDKKSLDQDHQH